MNYNKVIKDLKERNDKLANQRRQFEIRLINEQYLVEKKDKEIERLNNIINRMEEDLKEMYMTFGEFNEEYTEKKIRELKEGKE